MRHPSISVSRRRARNARQKHAGKSNHVQTDIPGRAMTRLQARALAFLCIVGGSAGLLALAKSLFA